MRVIPKQVFLDERTRDESYLSEREKHDAVARSAGRRSMDQDSATNDENDADGSGTKGAGDTATDIGSGKRQGRNPIGDFFSYCRGLAAASRNGGFESSNAG